MPAIHRSTSAASCSTTPTCASIASAPRATSACRPASRAAASALPARSDSCASASLLALLSATRLRQPATASESSLAACIAPMRTWLIHARRCASTAALCLLPSKAPQAASRTLSSRASARPAHSSSLLARSAALFSCRGCLVSVCLEVLALGFRV